MLDVPEYVENILCLYIYVYIRAIERCDRFFFICSTNWPCFRLFQLFNSCCMACVPCYFNFSLLTLRCAPLNDVIHTLHEPEALQLW